MEIQDRNTRKAKAVALDSLMRNEKLSRAITDGLNSPAGSSRRAHALSLLRSVGMSAGNRFGTSFPQADGKGGNGAPVPAGAGIGDMFSSMYGRPTQGQNMTPDRPTADAFTQVYGTGEAAEPRPTKVLAGPSPKEVTGVSGPQLTLTETGAAVPAGQEPAGRTSDAVAQADRTAALVASLFEDPWYTGTGLGVSVLTRGGRLSPDAGPPASYQLAGGTVATGAPVRPLAVSAANLTGSPEYTGFIDENGKFRPASGDGMLPIPGVAGRKSPDLREIYGTPGLEEHIGDRYVSPRETFRFPDEPVSGFRGPGVPAAPAGPTVPTSPQETADAALNSAKNAAMEGGTGETPEEIIENVISDTGNVPPTPEATDLGFGDRYTFSDAEYIFDKYGEEEFDRAADAMGMTDDVRELVKSGMSKEMMVSRIMADPDMLSQVLGVPKEALAHFPQDGFLMGHIYDLRDSIKKEHGLDEMRDRIRQKQLQGLTLESDLSNYITGKDEYLSKIDQLIYETEDRMAEMDTSNPYVAKRMEGYMAYLNILKGRQSKRYVDFLNQSVQLHDAALARLEQRYDTEYERASDEFAQMKDITVEQFQWAQNVIRDLYDNEQKQEEIVRERKRFEMEMAKALYDMALTAAQTDKIRSDIGATGDVTSFDFTPNRYRTQLNVRKEIGADGEETWKLSKLEDPTLAYDAAVTAEENPDIYLRKLYEDTGIRIRDLMSVNDTETLSSELGSVFEGMMYQAAVTESMPEGTAKEARKAQLLRMAGEYRAAVQGAVGQGLEESLKANGESLQAAIRDLTGKGLFNLAEGPEDRDSFVGRHDEAIDETVLQTIFDLTMAGIRDGMKAKDIFTYPDGGGMWEGDSDRTVETLMPYVGNAYVNKMIGAVTM